MPGSPEKLHETALNCSGRRADAAHAESPLRSVTIGAQTEENMKNQDQVKGKVKDIKGNIREEAGKLTGKRSEQIGGKKDKAAGKVQKSYGDVKENFSDD